jgi:hypothetical protein
MVYEAGALDATIAAAAGDDQALFLELRTAFLDSLTRQIDLLRRARCDANWEIARCVCMVWLQLSGLAADLAGR